MFKKKEPKYNIGDKVRFVDRYFLGGGSVYIGRILRVYTHWFREPSYEIFKSIDIDLGYDYIISESDIMELLGNVTEKV